MGLRNFEVSTKTKYLSEEQIIKALNKKDNGNPKNHLINYAYILHDKDKADSHWHILIRMDNNYTFEYVAKRFEVPGNQVKKIETTFSNALNYLTHNTAKLKKKINIYMKIMKLNLITLGKKKEKKKLIIKVIEKKK